MISVLMSVYNSERYVADSINSILNQSFKEFEFIIIDDASTDLTVQEIKKFKDERIKLIINKENKGLTKNLNAGLFIAKGKFIARMDADDIALPNKFEEQIEFFNKNPQVGVLGTNGIEIGESHRNIKWPANHESIKAMMLINNPIMHSSVMIRSSILKKTYYDEMHRTAQDYELWSRLIWLTKFENLQKPLMKYRVHQTQTTAINRNIQMNSANYARINMVSKILELNEERIQLFLQSCSLSSQFNVEDIRKIKEIYVEIIKRNKELKVFSHQELFGVLSNNLDRVQYIFSRSNPNHYSLSDLKGLGANINMFTIKKYIGPIYPVLKKIYKKW